MLDERKENRRLRLIRIIDDRFQGKQALIAAQVGIIPNLISRYVRGVKGIGEDMRDKIEVACGLPPGWLDDHETRDPHHAQQPTAGDLPPSSNGQQSKRAAESPVNDKGEPMQTAQILTIAASNTRDTITIPQYDAGGAMGHGLVLPEQPGVIERWTVSREWLEKNARGFTSAGNLCIVTGFGPSMRPMFNPGDPLLVDTGVKSVIADGIYFFRIDDKGYIKQLQQIPKSGGGIVYRAKSANPAYDSFEIDEGHDFEILGRVIRVWCGTDF